MRALRRRWAYAGYMMKHPVLLALGYLSHIIATWILYIHRAGNIRIMTPTEDERPVRLVREALSLIQELDPRRFKRVERGISWILCGGPLRGRAHYRWMTKTCAVDLSNLNSEFPEGFQIKELACLIVHESTHGRLHALYILQTRSNNLRVERLCIAESQRFARRFESEFNWEGYLLGSFPDNVIAGEDEQFAGLFKTLKRVSKALRDAKSKGQ
jgi:hypothetical protein